MRYGRNICQREGCGYMLEDLEVVDGHVVCPECGEVNSEQVFTPFPTPLKFVHLVSKPWYVGIVLGVLLSVPGGLLARLLWGIGLILAMGFLVLLHIAIIYFSRRLMLREVQYAQTVPEWAWNGFFMPTLVWSVLYWMATSFVMSAML